MFSAFRGGRGRVSFRVRPRSVITLWTDKKAALRASRPTKVLLVFGFPSKNQGLIGGNIQENILIGILGGELLVLGRHQTTCNTLSERLAQAAVFLAAVPTLVGS
ncbi:MAG: hypothetical protein ACRERV_09615, partial [Methylococcales bacterium]